MSSTTKNIGLFTEVKAAPSKSAKALGKEAVGTHTSGSHVQTRDLRTADRSDDERRLKEFDLDNTFGPCVGISRLDRWERAKSNGLEPPADVLRLIQQNSGDPSYTQNLWNDRL
eukprot:m.170605 g.170605  ORF g.170605 m.170605 type:complete len:114 (-) comp13262_c0_seq1:264-605(-)